MKGEKMLQILKKKSKFHDSDGEIKSMTIHLATLSRDSLFTEQ